MTLGGLPHLFEDQLFSISLHTLRLLPVAFLCPFLGGALVPPMARLAIALGLGCSASLAQEAVAFHRSDLPRLVVEELALGCVIGVVASMPLQAARAGGRLADTLRGATLSELHVPLIRQRETALGDLLSQWSVVLASWVGGDRLVVGAILGTFEAVPIGRHPPTQLQLSQIIHSSSELMACAIALASPAAAGVLAADLTLALAARFAPTVDLAGAVQPARATLGLLALVAAAATLGGRLMSSVALSATLIQVPPGVAP